MGLSIYRVNRFMNFVEIRYDVLPLEFVGKFWYSDISIHNKANLHKGMHGIFHVSHEPFHKFCLSPVWEYFINLHFFIPIFNCEGWTKKKSSVILFITLWLLTFPILLTFQ
jgi:hypothetical protein